MTPDTLQSGRRANLTGVLQAFWEASGWQLRYEGVDIFLRVVEMRRDSQAPQANGDDDVLGVELLMNALGRMTRIVADYDGRRLAGF